MLRFSIKVCFFVCFCFSDTPDTESCPSLNCILLELLGRHVSCTNTSNNVEIGAMIDVFYGLGVKSFFLVFRKRKNKVISGTCGLFS